MNRFLTAAALSACLATPSFAQPPKVDLSKLNAEVKTLKWRDIDWSTVNPLDRIRALTLIDETLEELGAQMTAEADLMSQYIDQNNLGSQFAAAPPLADKSLTMQDAQRVAIALLRGPMAKSAYATMYAGTDASMVPAYEHMYTSTCNRKWAGASEARHQVRAMTRFLETSNKMADYAAWAPGEVQRQTQAADAVAAAKRAAALQSSKEEQLKQQQAELDRQKKFFAEQQQAAAQYQQALTAAQAAQASENTSTAINNSLPPVPYGDTNYYYGGGAYLGAAAATAWYRNPAYRGEACARTAARMGGWHGVRR